MLNTVMALWNQNPAENRQRTAKILFTTLFIGISIFLLLFSFNGSIWPLFVGAEDHQLKKEKQPQINNHRTVITAGNTPVGTVASIGITPTATPTSTRTIVQPCTQAPIIVVQPTAIIPSLQLGIYSGQHALKINPGEPKQIHHPKVAPIKKAVLKTATLKKTVLHVRKRPEVRVVRPSVPLTRKTPAALPSPAPSPIVVSNIVQSPSVPVVTVSPTATPVAVGVSVVNDVVDSGAINVTLTPSATTSNNIPFEHSLRRNATLGIPISPLAKNQFKTHLYRSENIGCSKSTISEDSHIARVLKVRRSDALLLSLSVLGTLLLSGFVSIFRR